MKIFLIIIGCIFLYIFGVFITVVLFLYIDRCEYESTRVYEWSDGEDIGLFLGWPITIWFALGYLLFLKLKKYAIAITEVLYQINHKEDKDDIEDHTDDDDEDWLIFVGYHDPDQKEKDDRLL